MAKQKPLVDPDPRWTSEVAPAPGDLRMVQGFLNADFTDPPALADWLEFWDLLPPGTSLHDDDLRRSTEVCGALRSLVAANHGEAVSAKSVELLDQAVTEAQFRVRFEADGQARFEAAEGRLDGALARLFGLVAVAQSEGTWPHLRICAIPSCRAVFFAKSRRGKFCSRRCNSRGSSLTYRHRNLERIRTKDRNDIMHRRFHQKQ